MKAVTVLVVFSGILLRSTLAASISCPEPLLCPCGSSRKVYTHCLDEASVKGHTCETWFQCETCQANVTHCITCPPGRTGPTCTETLKPVLTCDDPGSISSGYRIFKSGTASRLYPFYTNGQSFQYYCNQGYRIAGNDVLVCLPSGEWSNPKPSCQPMRGTVTVPEEPFCPHPGVDVNGFMESDDVLTFSKGKQGYVPGAELKYSCRESYELVGKDKLVCKLNGAWSAPTPACRRHSNPTPAPTGPFCYHPGVDVNGLIESETHLEVYGPRQGFPAGAEVRYKCKRGFELVGASTLVCKLDGKWSVEAPTCKRVQKPTAPPLTGKICFVPSLDLNIVMENIPPHDPRRRGDAFVAGSQVSFTCRNGYELDGSGSIVCLLNGKWNSKPPTCKSSAGQPPRTQNTTLCADPGSVNNGGVIVYYNDPNAINQFYAERNTYPVNTRLSYDCSEGYVLRGEKNISCQPDGQWTGEIPKCVADCGHSKFRAAEDKITVGNKTKAGEFPWVVHIWVNETKQSCAGVLLDRRTVLSAAHCFQGVEYCTLYFGKYNRSDSADDRLVETRKSSEIIPHPEYNKTALFDNDIAIIKFSPEVSYSPRIQPICMPTLETTAESIVPGKHGYVAGWGLNESQIESPTLMVAGLPVQNDTTCVSAYERRRQIIEITEGMFCAGFSDKKTNACRGDSGSPLVFYNVETNRYTMEGLVSHGTRGRCDEPGKYTMFTRVSHYLQWIRQNW